MITDPDRCIVLGGTWRTPVAMGLQPKTSLKTKRKKVLSMKPALAESMKVFGLAL